MKKIPFLGCDNHGIAIHIGDTVEGWDDKHRWCSGVVYDYTNFYNKVRDASGASHYVNHNSCTITAQG